MQRRRNVLPGALVLIFAFLSACAPPSESREAQPGTGGSGDRESERVWRDSRLHDLQRRSAGLSARHTREIGDPALGLRQVQDFRSEALLLRQRPLGHR